MLEQVARERYPGLVARAMLLVRSRAEAEDLVQDALVAVFGGRARFATPAEAEQYVRRAIFTRFVDGTRRHQRERAAVERVGGWRAQVDVGPEARLADELAGPLEAALARLSPRQRACVVLRHVEDLSTAETAAVLGLSEGAVKRYLSDGVAALNAALGTTAPRDSVPVLPSTEVRHDA
ncbi:RNA polymerase sigma factor [Cellulomonas alba]|uniref:Sigma-70 family RNA polymerase sigma factor n=1 Tax=Cellulomonas alba TaxID=3053467 RepID=A0ABT7SHI4_9CELL|nr:sigma-70 family RNA polymerase sigma factor [Cellulomonas alba]MDM7855017.1 sigma-70 family RNA polymerase sigma factor [Cellulomonas alba]